MEAGLGNAELDETYDDVKGLFDLIEETLRAGDEEWIWEVNKEEEPLEALRERLTDLVDEYKRLAIDADRKASGLHRGKAG
jgi:hypothetical protein